MIVQVVAAIAAAGAVLLFPGTGPSDQALGWGALAGLGSVVGTLGLYSGYAVAPLRVAETCSSVLSAVIPGIVGIALGEQLSLFSKIGLCAAIPAITLVVWQPDAPAGQRNYAGVGCGIGAGVGFAMVYIGLDYAGTAAGAWPLVANSSVALLLVAPLSRYLRKSPADWRLAGLPATAAGVAGTAANLLFLFGAGHRQLAIAVVLTALYPSVTVILARIFLAERCSRSQTTGLVIAVAAIALTLTR
ncbi:MAG: EamA family transporter [Pseudonocardiales bacterium]|nr:EamA family transporter [Pseudonocardiales bacterium]